MIAVDTNNHKGIAVAPDMIVITLNGKGVIPAISTVQNPMSLNRVAYSAMAWALPNAINAGSAICSNANIPMA